MGRYGTPDSWKAIPWMFPAGNHPCNNTFIIIFVVVYNIGISQLSYFIPGWKMVRQPFLIRLGSKGALWWHTLFDKKEILRLDEMVYEKIIAAFRMGGLESKYRIGNSHIPYRITLWSDLFPPKVHVSYSSISRKTMQRNENMDMPPVKVAILFCCIIPDLQAAVCELGFFINNALYPVHGNPYDVL